MIKTTIDGLRDFQACTLYHKFKYEDNLKVGKVSNLAKTQEQFKITLESIINFFFYKKQAYSEPSYKVLENKWEKKWLKDKDVLELAFGVNSANNNYPTDAFYTRKATEALLEFHNWFSDKPNLEVVLIKEPFTVPLNQDLALEGCFDLVLRSKKPNGDYKYHVYTWAFYAQHNSKEWWSTTLTALDYAFRYRNKNKALDVAYYIWDFTDPEPGVRSFLVEIKDHELLRLWADDMVSRLNEESVFPIRGLSEYCRGCRYDKPCQVWERSIE